MFSSILNFLFPPLCLGCKKEGQFLCPDCGQRIKLLTVQQCPLCWQESSLGKVCIPCRLKNPQFSLDGLIVSGKYSHNPLLQTLIKTFKFRYNQDLVNQLGEILTQTYLHHQLNHPLLTPVPLHFFRQMRRGFNQSALLSAYLSQKTGLKSQKILHRIKNTLQQSQLNYIQRIQNLKNAFKIKKKLPKKTTFLLIDDVATTLSTLNECAQVLKKYDPAAIVWGLVIARG
jgi:ComF family protein